MGVARDMRGFSLIEVAIVIAILGVLGLIAIPRVSRACDGASESRLATDLSTLRRAIELYRSDHDGLPPTSKATFVAQLTRYTNLAGATSTTRTAEYCFGPYLCRMPALAVGENKGSAAVRDTGLVGSGSEGWFYAKSAGNVFANTDNTEVDARGVRYNDY